MTDSISSSSRPHSVRRGEVLWAPPKARRDASDLAAFCRFLRAERGLELDTYDALHRWSTESLEEFWESVWRFCRVRHAGKLRSVLNSRDMPGALWFDGVAFNFAESLLFPSATVSRDQPAIIFENETTATPRVFSFAHLRDQVSRCAGALAACGVEPGDRVAGFLPNLPETVIAMLAAASLGAVWSSCSPDFGASGVVDRFGQIEPKVLFTADGYEYNGKRHALGDRIASVVSQIESIQRVIVIPYSGPPVEAPIDGLVGWEDFLSSAEPSRGKPRFPFSHPLYILYTSGTTGKPKCLVHSAGGTLLKHMEEHRLQVDIRPGDRFFYFTTCGWMMWNWLISGLASGATLVLYDGSPVRPSPTRLFDLIDRNQISVFGASPRYLSMLQKEGLRPVESHSLESLRTILSTGAPLHAEQYAYVYDAIKGDVELASISGGTDIVGCFVLGSPFHAVRAGQIACAALGMKVESVDEQGQPHIGRKGELVCSEPFPSIPLGFWNDPDGSRFRAAYFEKFPGRWHHGDFIEITPEGSAIIHGRSDATLNPGGVRIGTAEIYRVVETVPGVDDALAVGLEEDGDTRILLYVVPRAGCAVDDELRESLRKAIRSELSPRHVPAEIHPIREVPRTISGKSVEIAVARILRGEEPGNREALANPQALDQFKPRK